MTELRQRMIADLEIRNYSDNTVKAYVRAVAAFAKFFRRSPGRLGLQQIRDYQIHLVKDQEVAFSTLDVAVCALRFFYQVTLGRRLDVTRIPFPRKRKRLPVVLSPQEVSRFFAVIRNVKHRALFMTIYASGLRVSEVVHLRLSDIDSQRMVLRVEQGKGNKDRYTLLSPKLLDVLRTYWKVYRPDPWLFYGYHREQPLTARSVARPAQRYARLAGLRKPVTPHTLRHCFATHLLEAGTNIETIRRLLGHRCLRSTQVYIHLAREVLQNTTSPLDRLEDIDREPRTES